MIKEPELEVVPVYGDMPEMIFDSLIICNKKRCFRIFFLYPSHSLSSNSALLTFCAYFFDWDEKKH